MSSSIPTQLLICIVIFLPLSYGRANELGEQGKLSNHRINLIKMNYLPHINFKLFFTFLIKY